MLFWHLGANLWLFRWIFRDPKVDVRFLLFGAILPDLIDMPIGTLILANRYSTGELWFHSLILPSLYMSVVMLAKRRGRRRRAWMAVGVAWLFHLLLDGMWTDQEVFLWPLFGLELPSGLAPFWQFGWERGISDPWRWVKELAGLGYLVWLWIALGMNRQGRRRATIETGRLPDYVAHDV